MRKAAIYYKEFLAGILTETDDGDYTFQYEEKIMPIHQFKNGIGRTADNWLKIIFWRIQF